MGHDSAWMGDGLGTPGVAGIGSGIDAAKRHVERVKSGQPQWFKYVYLATVSGRCLRDQEFESVHTLVFCFCEKNGKKFPGIRTQCL